MQGISKAALCLVTAVGSAAAAKAAAVADSVYLNGNGYTVDSHDSLRSAIAIDVVGGKAVYRADTAL